jgi:hypothetical protein
VQRPRRWGQSACQLIADIDWAFSAQTASAKRRKNSFGSSTSPVASSGSLSVFETRQFGLNEVGELFGSRCDRQFFVGLVMR